MDIETGDMTEKEGEGEGAGDESLLEERSDSEQKQTEEEQKQKLKQLKKDLKTRPRLVAFLPGPSCHPHDAIRPSSPTPDIGGQAQHSADSEEEHLVQADVQEILQSIKPEIQKITAKLQEAAQRRGMSPTLCQAVEVRILDLVRETIMTQRKEQRWADNVFLPDYNLLTKAQLREYIEQHDHLPYFRSAKEIAKYGIDVRQDLPAAVEAIEVLYLYLLDDAQQTGPITACLSGMVSSVAHGMSTLCALALSRTRRLSAALSTRTSSLSLAAWIPVVLPVTLLAVLCSLTFSKAQEFAHALVPGLMKAFHTPAIVREVQRAAAGKPFTGLHVILLSLTFLTAFLSWRALLLCFPRSSTGHRDQRSDEESALGVQGSVGSSESRTAPLLPCVRAAAEDELGGRLGSLP